MATPPDFIGREDEIELFENMLAGNTIQRVLALIIKPQQGKTYLMLCFRELCQQQQIPVALVDFDTRQKGVVHYWKFVRQVCDDLGSGNFPEVDACEKRLHHDFSPVIQTGPGQAGTHFGTKGHFEGADFDRISGRDQLQTGDIITYFGPQDQSAVRQERLMHEMGRAFQSGLARICGQYRVVLLLDTYERVQKETRDWINEWVLDPLPDRYPSLIIVIAGRPELYDYFDRPRPWTALAHLREELTPPGEDDVRKYIEIHSIYVSGDEIRSFMKTAVYDISVMGKLRDVYKRCPHE